MDNRSRASPPQVRQPRLALPRGMTDTHFHVFGPEARYPYIPNRDFTPDDALPAEAERLFAAIGIERAVLVQASVYGNDNARHLSAHAEMTMPTRVVAAAGIDCLETEIARLAGLGAKGVRLMVAKTGWLDRAGLARLTRDLAAHACHLQLYVKPDQLKELVELLPALQCPVVIDHLGMIDPRGGLEQASAMALLHLLDTGCCWVKISGYYRLSKAGAPYADLDALIRALVAAAPERLLWGSDWPHPFFSGPIPQLADLIDPLFDWMPDDAVRRQVLVDNPAILFGFQRDGGNASREGAL